jgi:hypothetical protein
MSDKLISNLYWAIYGLHHGSWSAHLPQSHRPFMWIETALDDMEVAMGGNLKEQLESLDARAEFLSRVKVTQ